MKYMDSMRRDVEQWVETSAVIQSRFEQDKLHEALEVCDWQHRFDEFKIQNQNLLEQWDDFAKVIERIEGQKDHDNKVEVDQETQDMA